MNPASHLFKAVMSFLLVPVTLFSMPLLSAPPPLIVQVVTPEQQAASTNVICRFLQGRALYLQGGLRLQGKQLPIGLSNLFGLQHNECAVVDRREDFCRKNPCHPMALCANTNDSFTCTCIQDYEGDGVKACVPVDKCAVAKDNCDRATTRCAMVPGSTTWMCVCLDGFQPFRQTPVALGEKISCAPVDLCLKSPCNANAACVNTVPGAFKCTCKPGFLGDGHRSCVPLDHCAAGSDDCDRATTTCQMVPGRPAWTCGCRAGFERRPAAGARSARACTDVDECLRKPCHANGICSNAPGSFACACAPGFKGDGIKECVTVDACAQRKDDCERNTTVCEMLPGSADFVCKCIAGYRPTPDAHGKRCSDINECEGPKSPCHDHAMCKNAPGTFKCTCKFGYEGDGIKECRLIDACARKADDCDRATTKCEMAKDSAEWHCTCIPGYQPDAAAKGKRCVDINECAAAAAKRPCHSHAVCTNAPGSFKCACKTGYEDRRCSEMSDGTKECRLIDACARKADDCDRATTKCEMAKDKAEWQCACIPGYQPDAAAKGKRCVDVDECKDTKTPFDRASVACKNIAGSYELSCKTGYRSQHASDNTSLKCLPYNECEDDPAYKEALAIMVKGGHVDKDWKEWMPAPKNASSAYAWCYNYASSNKRLSRIASDKSVQPFCEDILPSKRSPYLWVNRNFIGWQCTCAPPNKRTEKKLGPFVNAICATKGCDNCPVEYNYECVDGSCRCREGYSAAFENGIAKCTNRECSISGINMYPSRLGDRKRDWIRCVNERWVPYDGFELRRDPENDELVDVVDVDECATSANLCCDNEAACKGPDCMRCFNFEGGYSCRSDTISCNSVDRATCKCKEPICPTYQSWFHNCAGCNASSHPAVAALNRRGPICSRLSLAADLVPITYPNIGAALEKLCSLVSNRNKPELMCGFDPDPSDPTRNPVFNYFGSCQKPDDMASVRCEGGAHPRVIFGDSTVVCPTRTSSGFPIKNIVGTRVDPSARPPSPECSGVVGLTFIFEEDDDNSGTSFSLLD